MIIVGTTFRISEHGGFINWHDNGLNWLILVGLVIYLFSRILPGALSARKQKIESAINDAQNAKKESQEFLAQQKQRIDSAQKEAENIRVEAKAVAEQMKQQMIEQTKKDVQDLEYKIKQQVETHRSMVITELRASAATVAVRLAEASLPGAITDNLRAGLQQKFVSQLDQLGTTK